MPLFQVNGYWAPMEYDYDIYYCPDIHFQAQRILIGGLYWGDMRIHADVEADAIEWIDEGLYGLAEVFRDYDRAGGDWDDETALRLYLRTRAAREYFRTTVHMDWLEKCVADYRDWVSGLLSPPLPTPVDPWWKCGMEVEK